jgi:regulator of sigma E protease
VALQVIRAGEMVELTLQPEMVREVRGTEPRYRPIIGIFQYDDSFIAGREVRKYFGITEAVPIAVAETAMVFGHTVKVLSNLVTRKLQVKESVGGPVAIFTAAGQSAEDGLFAFAELMGMISFSLGFINLLPVPVLDGGHIIFYTVEAIRGRPLSLEFRERVQMVGVLGLVALMLMVTAYDISRTFGGG